MNLINPNKKYTRVGKLVMFFVLVILSGLPWFFTHYQMFNSTSYCSVLILAIAAGYIKYNTCHATRETILVAMSAHQVTLILKFIKDGFEDPTNHNLAPFEMIIFLALDFFVLLLAMGFVTAIVQEKK